jgi:hypothetical protein
VRGVAPKGNDASGVQRKSSGVRRGGRRCGAQLLHRAQHRRRQSTIGTSHIDEGRVAADAREQ